MPRKADVFAKSKGSLADRLRARREALEAGNPMAAQKAARPKRRVAKNSKRRGY